MKVRIGAVALALTLGGFAAGCGGSDEKESEQTEQKATPKQAIAEIGEVRSGLDAALASYRAGDKAAADEQVGDAYLQHFEHVEGPLEKVDHELNEELEDGIREDLRAQIKAGKPARQIAASIRRLDAELDEAEAALRR